MELLGRSAEATVACRFVGFGCKVLLRFALYSNVVLNCKLHLLLAGRLDDPVDDSLRSKCTRLVPLGPGGSASVWFKTESLQDNQCCYQEWAHQVISSS